MSAPNIVKDRDPGWLRNSTVPGVTKTSFKSYKDIVKSVAKREMEEAPSNKEGITQWLDAIGGFAGTPNYSNSSVGCNDAFNPYWSFNEDDDIPLPMDKEIPGTALGGMGLVYKEMYQQYQQILWVTFGTPKFNTSLNFQQGAVNSSLASLMNRGDNSAVWVTLGRLLGDGFVFALELPFLPLLGAAALFKKLVGFGSKNVSAYYTIKNAMPLYYRMVNTLLCQIAPAMGLYSASSTKKSSEVMAKYKGSVPEVLADGPDIYAMKNRRAKALLRKNRPESWDSERIFKESMSKHPKTSIFDAVTGAIGGFVDTIVDPIKKAATIAASEAQGSGQYIGFRIEKSMGSLSPTQ